MSWPADIEWKIIYVGAAEDDSSDQILDVAVIGPVPMGPLKFVLEVRPRFVGMRGGGSLLGSAAALWENAWQAPAPDPSRIPPNELMGVTVVMLTCSYREREFVRVGYYVNIDYAEMELCALLLSRLWVAVSSLFWPATNRLLGRRENPPPVADVNALVRNILASNPRVTRFQVCGGAMHTPRSYYTHSP